MPNVSAIILAFLIAAAFITSYSKVDSPESRKAHAIIVFK